MTHTEGHIFKGLQENKIDVLLAFSVDPTAQGSVCSLKIGPWVDWLLVWTAEQIGSTWVSESLALYSNLTAALTDHEMCSQCPEG